MEGKKNFYFCRTATPKNRAIIHNIEKVSSLTRKREKVINKIGNKNKNMHVLWIGFSLGRNNY